MDPITGAASAVTSYSESRLRQLLRGFAWGSIVAFASALIVLAVFLLFRMGLFSSPDEPSEQQIESLWAFLGVALGVVATLIGALLTDQHNRRTDLRAQEAGYRQQLDTRAKVIELITEEGTYAEKARVGAALVTLTDLGGGAVVIRLLDELLESDRVGKATSVWFINEVIASNNRSQPEKAAAAELLVRYTAKLFPPERPPTDEGYAWSEIFMECHWPMRLPLPIQLSFLRMSINLLCGRPGVLWIRDRAFPLTAIENALLHSDHNAVSQLAAWILHDVWAQAGWMVWEPQAETEAAWRAVTGELLPSVGTASRTADKPMEHHPIPPEIEIWRHKIWEWAARGAGPDDPVPGSSAESEPKG